MENYLEQVYAGVLGKVIGVYMGRPFEGWKCADIEKRFGEINRYVNEDLGVPLVVSDDDISGTFTFVRALEDSGRYADTPPDFFGDNWLNYLIENRTILWWGGMGTSTERHNERYEVTREDQDAVAARSHQRAAAAYEAGVFDAELVPVEVPQRKGDPIRVTRDEGIRPETTAESLAGLRPAFAKDGTITAGNSSQISDGASAVVLTSRSHADAQGWPVLAVLGAAGQVAGPDNTLHAQPARAIAAACEKQSITPADLDLVEINEAFGAVVARSQRELGLDDDVVNPHGGGIAIGHPIGASGNRLVVHAVHELVRRGTGTAAVALCGGGGQGDALILTR